MYIPLHAHTSIGSIRDSILDINDYVKKAKEMGLTHLAITDHGSMSAMIDFYDACKANDIVPIIGMEAYVCPDNTIKDKEHKECYHLVLLAINEQGVKDLLRIHNDAQLNGFYKKPRTDDKILKKYGKNLIALSACVGGEIPKLAMSNEWGKCYKKIFKYKKIFYDFYLELQPGKFKEQIYVNAALVQLAKNTNTKLVLTNDIHYLNKEDVMAHNLHIKSSFKDDTPIDELRYPDTVYYMMAEEEVVQLVTINNIVTKDIVNEAVSNTVYIANQCNGHIDWNFKMPEYIGLPEGYTDEKYLSELCFKALSSKISNISDPSAYTERLTSELSVIKQLGFCGYFLIVWDLIQYAKKNNIAVGPGRGSCGGSIVSWLLDITVADPIKNGLLFERFLSVDRKGPVDIDIDFSGDRRGEMHDYTIKKYGKDNCALVGTFGYRKTRSAIKEAARLLNIPVGVANSITKCMKNFIVINGEKCMDASLEQHLADNKKLRQYSIEYPELFEKALMMGKVPVNVGVHAAGIVIHPDGLLDKMPLHWADNKPGVYASFFTKNNIEKVALKMDYLAINSISIIEKTKKDVGITIDLQDDSFYEDEDVWKLIGSDNTDGLFQISSSTYKARMPRLKPTNLSEMAACLALIRTPCIVAKKDEDYMRIIEGKQNIQNIIPEYDSATRDTNGICIYQEEVMQIAVNFGFTMTESYDILKAASKKKINKLKEYENAFYEKGRAKNISDSKIAEVFQFVVDAGQYSFNKSHAFCYGIITYESAWLKKHYPSYFYANLLSNAYINIKNEDVIRNIIIAAKKNKIEFLPIDVNKSEWDFKVENNKIRVGLCAVHDLGPIASEELINNRPYNSIKDLEKLSGKFKKNSGILLNYAGAFKSINEDIYETYREYCEVKKIKTVDEFILKKNSSIKFNTASDIFETEKLILGFAFCYGTEYNEYPESTFITGIKGALVSGSAIVNKIIEKTDKNNNKMAFYSLEDSNGKFNAVVFANVFKKIDSLIRKGDVIEFKGKKEDDDKCVLLSVNKAA